MLSVRAFREGAMEPEGVEAALDGLPFVDGGGAPKKSRFNKESEAFAGLGAAGTFEGCVLVPGVSVVLGLTGGAGGSFKKSIEGFVFGGGGNG